MLFFQWKQPLRWAISISWVLLLGVGQGVYAATTEASDSDLITHGASSGGKGKDTIKLKAPKLSGSSCAVFVDASVVYDKRRFGEAKIVAKPTKGCNPSKGECKLSVSWKHAPAGRLNYQVKASWKVKASGC